MRDVEENELIVALQLVFTSSILERPQGRFAKAFNQIENCAARGR
jgi:hypothetical protein